MKKTKQPAAPVHAGKVPVVCRRLGQSYTCVRVSEGPKFVHFIPMDTLQLTKQVAEEFYQEWGEYTEYPVRRAAELYLGAGEYREIGIEERKHLEAIVADPATVYDLAPQPVPKSQEVYTMATAKTAPAKTPAAKPGKTAAAAPAGKNPAKPAKNGMDTVVTGAKPAKNAAPAKADTGETRGRKPNVDASQKLTVAVKENPKREGSLSYDRFAAAYLTKPAPKTVGEAMANGASAADIAYDAAKGFITLA